MYAATITGSTYKAMDGHAAFHWSALRMRRPRPESAFGSIMSTNVTIQAISRGAGMVPEVSGRSAEPVAKICARLDPKQDMLKGGDADAVAKCWTFTNSL